LLQRLQGSTVLVGSDPDSVRGSGSFVGQEGLVLTNHHIVAPFLGKAGKDMRVIAGQGFLARTGNEELPIQGLEVLLPISARNFTGELDKSLDELEASGQSLTQEVFDSVLQGFEQSEARKTGMHCRWSFLDPQKEYWLQTYRVFKDVRLVMLPAREEIAPGGSLESSSIDMHMLDFGLLRVYERGKPYRPVHHLKASKKGTQDGSWVFIAGFPGNSMRWQSWSWSMFEREERARLREALTWNMRTLRACADTNPGCQSTLLSELAKARKRHDSIRASLRVSQPEYETRLAVSQREQDLQEKILRDGMESIQVSMSQERLKDVLEKMGTLAQAHQLLFGPESNLVRGPLRRALMLVRAVRVSERNIASQPDGAPNPDLQALISECMDLAPMDRGVEYIRLKAALEEAESRLGSGHYAIKEAFAGQDAESIARQAIDGTGMDDPIFIQLAARKGYRYLQNCADPMVRLAMVLDPWQRRVGEEWQTLSSEAYRHRKLLEQANRRFLRHDQYPEANGTLRFGFGRVMPGREDIGKGTAIVRFRDIPAWNRPRSWQTGKSLPGMDLALRFRATYDSIGGYSGAPVVNQHGEVVGVHFGGNGCPYAYIPSSTRGICVDVQAILWLIQERHQANALFNEMTASQ